MGWQKCSGIRRSYLGAVYIGKYSHMADAGNKRIERPDLDE